ncbi:MAG: hypothetical protein JSS62_03360 [Verrucomicrobia bacterium]|nr:hypothetical protein [Verrucomicrobiota bacterium]MBS0646708.1 hypothetical protein [Verrucomicrobiota bacterium]
MFKLNIPTARLILYVMILSFLPLTLTSFFFLKQRKAWNLIANKTQEVCHLSSTKIRKQSLNTLVRKHFAKSDPLYLEHRLQSLFFLNKERKALEKLIQSPNYTGNDTVEKRLFFLTEGANHILLDEHYRQTADGLTETIETSLHPVEIDNEDLKNILDFIEQDHPLKPQLIIRDFQLTKKAKSSGLEVFDLTFSLIKREFDQ